MIPRHVGVLVIMVFAKAPVPGAVKTRLIPVLGAQGAATLHARLTRDAVHRALHARLGPVQLWCTPSPVHPFFAACRRRFGVDLRTQHGADLGARMLHAFRTALKSGGAALLVGSDGPALEAADLAAAARALAGGADAVLTPAEDGGYLMIGLRRALPTLFDGISWGQADVLSVTRARLRALGVRTRELPERWDVDRPEDLARLNAVPRFRPLLNGLGAAL